MKVLVVEDNVALLQAIVAIFREAAYQVDEADHGDDGCFRAEQGIYDLIVLDVMLPGLSGIDVIRRLRARGIRTPALLLTARDSVEDRVAGLDAGADDYVVKPFAVPELLARARALLRRQGGLVEGELAFDRLTLKPKLLEAFWCGEPLRLTAKEYDVLEYLLLNKGQIVTRDMLFDRIWGFDSDTGNGIVDLYIHYLRKKLAPYDGAPAVQTVRGIGYMLKLA
ncbi:response regulator transcription factor [Paenibacillus cymbidii]|uniref:response regulator transcription factor n=1 Tax=Paenibacillus cymbidii TaxID=1639034 RepID=UPI001081F65C|nr:response regulator transcription factor [Paenibacillus cymbidii]